MVYPVHTTTEFPLLGYKIVEGGLGYRLLYDSYGEWIEVMDAVEHYDCVEAMHKDIKYAHEDRWGTL